MSVLLTAAARRPVTCFPLSRLTHSHRYDRSSRCPTHRSCRSARHPDAPDTDMDNPYVKEKVQCILCKYKVELDYKVSLSF